MKKDRLKATIFPDAAALDAALHALHHERFADAQVLLEQLPPNPQVLWSLGVALHGQNRHVEALTVLRLARRGLTTPADRIRCAIDIAITHNKRGAAAQAERLLRACERALGSAALPADRLKCALYLAVTHARRGRYQRYLDDHARIAADLDALGQPDLVAIGQVTACASLTNLHHYDEALALIARGIEHCRRHDLAYRLALFEFYRCRIGYETGVDAPDEARADALERLCDLTGAGLLKTDCLTLRAQLAHARGDLDLAMAHTRRAIDAFRSMGFFDGAAVCAVNMGIFCYIAYRFADALNWLDQAGRDAQAGGAHDTLATARFRAGWVHAMLGNATLARVKLEPALAAFQELGQSQRTLQAAALLALVDEVNRVHWQSQAYKTHAPHTMANASHFEAQALVWLAESHARQGDVQQAGALLTRATEAYNRLGLRIEKAGCELMLCALALSAGTADLDSLRARLESFHAELGALPDLDSQVSLLLAEIHQRQGQSDLALDTLSVSAAAATAARDNVLDPVLAGRIGALQARNFALGLNLAHRQQDVARAARFAGLRRSAGLRWRLGGAGRAGSSEAHAEIDGLTRARTRMRLARAAAATGDALPDPVLREIEFDAAQMARVPIAPSAAERPIDVHALREGLSRHFGTDWSFVSIEPLRPEQDAWLLLRISPVTAVLEKLEATPVASHMLKLLGYGDRAWRAKTYAPTRSSRSLRQQLAQWLRVREWLPAQTSAQHVLVVADTAPFSAIALGALPLDTDTELAQRTRLIHASEIWSAPRARASCDSARALVLAPGSFDGRHRALPASQREADAVAALWPHATVLAGERATIGALRDLHRSGALERFEIIVFATHAVFDAQQPRLSALALYDGELSVHELAQYPLNAALVCVSACDAGRFVPLGGEERLGIEQTLLHCGAANVIAPMWPVDDDAACLLATAVLTEYHDGHSVAQAFQRACEAAREHMAMADWAAWRHTAAMY